MNSPPRSEQDDCVHKLKILSDFTRLSVLKILIQEPKTVGELNAVLGLEQSLLSHHLRILREAGLVTSERDGKAVLYRLAEAVRSSDSLRGLNLGCCQLSFDAD